MYYLQNMNTHTLLSLFLIISFLTGLSMLFKNNNHNHEKDLKRLDFEVKAIELGYGSYSNGVFQWKK